MNPTTTEMIEWCNKESDRNGQMQGDRSRTNRRRKTFRFRNHMLAAVATRLESVNQSLVKFRELAVAVEEYTEGCTCGHTDPDGCGDCEFATNVLKDIHKALGNLEDVK